MVYAQTIFHPKNEMLKILWDFDIQTDHLILTRKLIKKDLVVW